MAKTKVIVLSSTLLAGCLILYLWLRKLFEPPQSIENALEAIWIVMSDDPQKIISTLKLASSPLQLSSYFYETVAEQMAALIVLDPFQAIRLIYEGLLEEGLEASPCALRSYVLLHCWAISDCDQFDRELEKLYDMVISFVQERRQVTV